MLCELLNYALNDPRHVAFLEIGYESVGGGVYYPTITLNLENNSIDLYERPLDTVAPGWAEKFQELAGLILSILKERYDLARAKQNAL